jgi:DnaJ-class molecular chaperone
MDAKSLVYKCHRCRGHGVIQTKIDAAGRCKDCRGTGEIGPWLAETEPTKKRTVSVVALPLPGSEEW